MANPIDSIVAGSALNTLGFESFNTLQGLGLITQGFIWPCDGIWGPAFPPVTTTWTVYSEPQATIETCLDIY